MTMKKFSFTKCGSSRYFSGSLAVFEERGERLNFFGFAAAPSEARGENRPS
jgi:hypothetical protein